jgi:hypothetical protein
VWKDSIGEYVTWGAISMGNILQQDILHIIELFDKKFLAICQAMFGIKIVFSQVNEEDEVPRTKEGLHESTGTHDNPIHIDEDLQPLATT